MEKKVAPWLALGALTVASAACTSSPVAVTPSGDVTIRLHMTGGIAGVDYTLVVDGERGEVIGESCRSVCDFEDGDVLLGVSDAQVRDWAARLLRGGIAGLDGTDFGSECCDGFQAELTYSDASTDATIVGMPHLMPAAFQQVVGELSSVPAKRLPIVVDLARDGTGFPMDPLTVDTLTLSGTELRFDMSYGGGCEVHPIGLVAVGGWMESFPVQVRVLLTHDDRDDPCDAILHETITFDLRPLADEYARAYPGGQPGETTLLLNLALPQGPGPQVPFVF